MIEFPPTEKKSSSLPTAGTFSTSAHSRAIRCSRPGLGGRTGGAGAVRAAVACAAARPATARRSIFPLGVVGMCSTATTSAGTM